MNRWNSRAYPGQHSGPIASVSLQRMRFVLAVSLLAACAATPVKPLKPRSQPSGGRILEARALERAGKDVGALEQLRIAAEEDPDAEALDA